MSSTFQAYTIRGAGVLSDRERIDAARWAARELVLGKLVGLSGPGWVHRMTAGGAIRSELPARAPARRARP